MFLDFRFPDAVGSLPSSNPLCLAAELRFSFFFFGAGGFSLSPNNF